MRNTYKRRKNKQIELENLVLYYKEMYETEKENNHFLKIAIVFIVIPLLLLLLMLVIWL